jgi:acyl-CoA thioesterase I
MVGFKALFILGLLLFQSAAAPQTILFFGDSLTAGYGLSTEEAFPALIEKKLLKKWKEGKCCQRRIKRRDFSGWIKPY